MQPLSVSRAKFAAFLTAVEAGMSDVSAASLTGLNRTTVLHWMESESPWGKIVRRRVWAARSKREQRLVAAIDQAAFTHDPKWRDWRAAAWLLERTMPQLYGRREAVTLSGAGGEPVRFEHTAAETLAIPDPERMQKVLTLLRNAGALPDLTPDDPERNGKN